MDVSPLREGEKLRGVATPVGSSIYFVTPDKTTEKEYTGRECPEETVSALQTRNPLTAISRTLGSAKK